MRHYLTRSAKLAFPVLATLALVACGSANSKPDGITVPGLTTAFVAGSLSDATLVAVDAASNTEERRVAAPGYRQSFSLPLTIGKNYKFYLVQNEGSAAQRVYPLYQGSANRFSISSTTSMDFGYLSVATGVARPANDVTLTKGVAGAGEDAAIPATLSASAFSKADLQGDWQVLQLVVGSNSRWIRKTITINAAGSSPQADYVSSQDRGTTPAASFSVTSGGAVTSQVGISGLFSGAMTRDKSMIIGTLSLDAGNQALVVMLKSGTLYSQADLQGDWKIHRLIGGGNPAWARADATLDAGGGLSVANAASSAGAGGVLPDTLSGALAIDPAGSVGDPALPAFYGVMSAGKDLVFAVNTDSGAAPSLTLFTRVKGAAATRDGLRGSWRANWLSAPKVASGSSAWGRAFYQVDSGVSYLESMLQNNGALPDAPLTTEVSATGTVAFSGSDFSGFVSPAGDFMVGVMTEGNGNLSLYTFIK